MVTESITLHNNTSFRTIYNRASIHIFGDTDNCSNTAWVRTSNSMSSFCSSIYTVEDRSALDMHMRLKTTFLIDTRSVIAGGGIITTVFEKNIRKIE